MEEFNDSYIMAFDQDEFASSVENIFKCDDQGESNDQVESNDQGESNDLETLFNCL